MYSFAQRTDTTVIDEPFYAYYLNTTGAKHPGREKILDSMAAEPEIILGEISRLEQSPIIFLKNMAHHFYQIDLSFLLEWQNVIFIRDPKQIIASFSRVIEKPTLFDIGVEEQFNLYQYLIANRENPLVLNSNDLLVNSRGILERLCLELDILMDEKMLSWKAGPRKEDGIWAKYWYGNVHKSTGFKMQKTKNIPIPEHLVPLYHQAVVYYDQLNKLAIKP